MARIWRLLYIIQSMGLRPHGRAEGHHDQVRLIGAHLPCVFGAQHVMYREALCLLPALIVASANVLGVGAQGDADGEDGRNGNGGVYNVPWEPLDKLQG